MSQRLKWVRRPEVHEMRLTAVVEQGFWPDTAGYYSEPRPLLTIDHLSGTKNDLVKKMKLLLTAAYAR